MKINVYGWLTNELNLNLRLYDACSTKPTVLDCTYPALSLSRIQKEANKTKLIKSQKPSQKETFLRIVLACFSNI